MQDHDRGDSILKEELENALRGLIANKISYGRLEQTIENLLDEDRFRFFQREENQRSIASQYFSPISDL